MKLHLVILASLLAAGCEKSSNAAATQDEATAITNHYKHRFEELTRRLGSLEQRGRSMVSVGTPQGLQDVRKLFVDTNRRLSDLKVVLNQAPNAIATAAKSENSRLELIRVRDELDERFEKGEIEVTAQIDQVEQWLAYVDYRPKQVAATEPAKTDPPVANPENPDGVQPNGQPNPPTGDGSGAPPAPAGTPPKTDEPKSDVDAKNNQKKTDSPKDGAPKKNTAPTTAPAAGSGSGSGR